MRADGEKTAWRGDEMKKGALVHVIPRKHMTNYDAIQAHHVEAAPWTHEVGIFK